MEIIMGVTVLLLPGIVFLPVFGVAVARRWWPHNTLSIICGFWCAIMLIYYMFIFGIQKFWPIYIIIPIFSILGWDFMRIIFQNVERREMEKAKQDNK